MQRIIVLAFILLISCSGIKQNMNRNNKFTDSFFKSLSERNGNAFYIKSSYSTFSTVWSYYKGDIVIYYITNGKLQKKQKLDATNFLEKIAKKEVFELDKCLELDGDIIGYRVTINQQTYKEEFPIGINCFLNKKYESKFLNNLVKDIINYKLYKTDKINPRSH